VDGQLKPDLPPREAAQRQWNIPAMLKALGHEDADVRSMLVSNLMLEGTRTGEALPILRQALINSERRVRWLAVTALLHSQRMELSLEDAERFELESQRHSEDCALHLLLLGYFFTAKSRSEAARLARQKHVLWVIERAAELVAEAGPFVYLDPSTDGEAYVQAKQIWLRHVEADESNTTLLGGAADFFVLHDRELSEALLKKAQRLEPNNSEWSERLGHLYALGSSKLSGEARHEAATRSFEELERAFACEQAELQLFMMLPKLAKAAFEAGQFDKARTYATDLLSWAERPDFFYHKNGDAIHYGNLVLGRLALRAGDREKAKRHLLESAKMQGSPCLCSSGPNMALAKELPELGERAILVEFLSLCTDFWKTSDHRAEQWIYAIEHGQNPDFGYNL
jgi:hypothetical protein